MPSRKRLEEGHLVGSEKDRLMLYMIGNAHIDPVWLWRYAEGLQVTRATFRSALERMNEDPDFVFTCSSAALYDWVERTDPELFQQIKRRVAEGRWRLVGGFWVEPDCNIPSGESFIRHGLYAQRYFQSRFGRMAKVGFNIDSFGHNAMLPQILKGLGIDFYTFLRPGPHENPDIPGRLFWWRSPNGSRVLAYQIADAYTATGERLRQMVKKVEGLDDIPSPRRMVFYGVGDHGGGPTRENIAFIRELQQADGPAVIFSDPERYFADVLADGGDFPEWNGELQHHASGCYAVHSEVKKLNRQAENLLAMAEFAYVGAHLYAQPPVEFSTFEEAWRLLLFNQFHDIMAGTSIKEAYGDAAAQLGRVKAIAQEALNLSLAALCSKIQTKRSDIPEDSIALVVFNPTGWERREVIDAEFQPESRWPGHVIRDENGKKIESQSLKPSCTTTGGRRRAAFSVSIPPFGYRVYYATPTEGDAEQAPIGSGRGAFVHYPEPATVCLENELIKVFFSEKTGYITRLVDKRLGFDVVKGEAAVPLVLEDESDTWSHGVFSYTKQVGRFGRASCQVIEAGPVRVTLRVKSYYGRSQLTQDFTLARGASMLECRAVLKWEEQQKVLKLAFPVAVSEPQATYEIPYGAISRPVDGEEEAAQRWVDVTGTFLAASGEQRWGGLSVLNDAKYSFDVTGNTLHMTVLRSPVYAHHDPAVLQPGTDYDYIDQGKQQFAYALYPHGGDWQAAKVVQAGLGFNRPLVCLPEYLHSGELPPAMSMLQTSGNGVIVAVVKRHEDSDDIVVRCYNPYSEKQRVDLSLPAADVRAQVELAPREICTLRLPRSGGEAQRISMLE